MTEDPKAADYIARRLQLEEEELTRTDCAEFVASARLPEVDLIDLRLHGQHVEPVEVGNGGPEGDHGLSLVEGSTRWIGLDGRSRPRARSEARGSADDGVAIVFAAAGSPEIVQVPKYGAGDIGGKFRCQVNLALVISKPFIVFVGHRQVLLRRC